MNAHEILAALESESEDEECVIDVEPPIEQSGQATDDKSVDKHNGNTKQLGRTLPQSGYEPRRLRSHRNDAIPSTSSGLQSSHSKCAVSQTTVSCEDSDDEDNLPLSYLARKNLPKKPKAKKRRRL